MSCLVSLPFHTLFIDAFFHSLLFAALCVMLWIVLQYGKYETLMPVQRVLCYGILAIIIVALGVGTGYFLDCIFLEKDEIIALISALPLKAMTGVMLYVIFVLYFYVNLQRRDAGFDTEPESSQPEPVQPESAPDETVNTELLERIMVKTKQQIKVIAVTDIIYFRSEGDYVMIITKEGKYLKEQTMKYIESHLPKGLFIRVHRSYIVNIEYISAIESYGKQNQQVLLKNGDWLKVSLAGYKALKETLR
jgi:hypothetical protein